MKLLSRLFRRRAPAAILPELFGRVVAESIVKAVTADPNKPLSPIGFRWACAIALKRHWPDLDTRTAAYWLTDYIGVPVGTHGYDWTYAAAQDLAREYVEQFGEAA